MNSAAAYAKRFAAKEALSKALGVGIRKNVTFKNIGSFGKKAFWDYPITTGAGIGVGLNIASSKKKKNKKKG